jgi:hypothetical protein
VHVHQLPSGPQDHADALTAIIDKVSEYYGQALQGVSLDVKKLFSIGLDHLQEDGHPLVESVI